MSITAVDLTFTSITTIFTNPNNIKVEDGAYSTKLNSSSGVATSINVNTNASSVIPAGNVIHGIIITVKGYVTGSGAVGNSYLELSGIIPYQTFPRFPNSSNTKYTYGASNDPLGVTSPSQLDSLMFRFVSYGAGPINFYIDLLKVTVYHGPPIPKVAGLFFGENF